MLITKFTFKSGAFYLLNILLFNSNFKIVCDYIYLSVPLNQLQHLIVKEILDHAIRNKKKIYYESNQQLLIYIRDKDRVEKSKIVKAIEIGIVLLERRNELVISVLTNSTVNRIDGSIVHIAIEVNT